MAKDIDESLGDQHTFDGGGSEDSDGQSLGDEKTFAGGDSASNSLGDELTFAGGGGTDDDVDDDGMEVQDLEARYTTEGVLGKGGMGEVLLATDTRLNRKVAIKRILGDAARSKTAVNRFLTEAQSIAALNHPNIVQIYDYGRATDGPFLIMEFVEGSSLLERCREGALPLEEAIELTCQICDGLGKAHEADIIHRDIKPANILLTTDGTAKLTDFGLAKAETADTGMTMAGAVLGTLDFMPPEQRRDAALTDSRSDLWALAATLYQLVTGKSPKVIRLDLVDESVRPVLARALEEESADRYQTAREFKDALLASQQASVAAVELEEGDCPSCGTKNPTSRKFCRNPDCSTSLEVPCLSCSAKIPMWEQVCDSCGTPQGDLLEQRRSEMASEQAEAESLLKDYDFDGAKKLAVALGNESDLRLQHLHGWAEEFAPQIEEGRQQQLTRIGEWLDEALAHQEAHDYAAGVRVLEQVPEILRETRVEGHDQSSAGLRGKLQGTLDEIDRLNGMIRKRVKQRDLNGLLSEVEKLQSLQPPRSDLKKLQEQLVGRDRKLKATREEALIQAKDLFESHDYDGCLRQLARIDASLEDAELTVLRETAEEKRSRLQSLRDSIAARVKSKQLHNLLASVEEALELQSGAEDLQKLQAQLREREEKNAAAVANVLKNAKGLRSQCQFDAAITALEQIPNELTTQKSDALLEYCRSLAFQRAAAMDALQQAMQSKDYATGLTSCLGYRSALEEAPLEDAAFAAEYQACQQGQQQQEQLLEQQREAEEAAIRQRERTVRLGKYAAAAVVVLILLVAGLWIRSSMRASALIDAVQEERWDDVLAIDAQHVPALIGRANQVASGTVRTVWDRTKLPLLEAAFVDIALAKQLNPTYPAIKPVKALAHANRARVHATDGKISDAAKDLKEAQSLGASDSQLTPVRRLLAAAYVNEAEEGVRRGDAAAIRAACDAAAKLQGASADVTRLRAAAFKAEGEQKEKSGDLSGAVAAFDEWAKMVNLAQRLLLRKKRAVLHVKLGQRAVAEQDYQTASAELNAAAALDESVSSVAELAADIAQSVLTAFETDASAANQTAALAAFRSVLQIDSTAATTDQLKTRLIMMLSRPIGAFETDPSAVNQAAALAAVKDIASVDRQNAGLPVLRGRITTAVLARGALLARKDPGSGLADYELALSMGATTSDAASLKGLLVASLVSRCRQSLTSQEVAKASADYAIVAKLDSEAADSLVAGFEKLPSSVLSQLPSSVWSQLPPSVLSQLPPSIWPVVKNTLGIEFKPLPGGTFTMGDANGDDDETPHQVTLTKAFELGVYEVTQEQYEAVMGTNPSEFKGPRNPVEKVSWDDAVEFCRKLSALPAEKKAGYVYRLPTEAEWEYACRAGTTTTYSFGDSDSQLGDYAWYDKNSGDTTHPVGQKKPNPWGLYDMHGNVFEWCQDWAGDYPSGSLTDPAGAAVDSYRVYRGGCWNNNSGRCRSANRDWDSPDYRGRYLGFRVLRSSIE